MRTALVFTPGGAVRGLYTEAVDLARFGSMSIERAIRIEFDNGSGQWLVYPPDSNAPLHSSPSRRECIEWEHGYIEKMEDEKHDRTARSR